MAGRAAFAASLLLAAAAGCMRSPRVVESAPALPAPAAAAAAPDRPLATVDAFTGPEAVRYDADQDVYFVANFGAGESGARDNNGFISRMRPDGTIENLRFIAGGSNGVTLHAPRGMAITGDTLWAADNDAMRGYHRRTGAPLATVDVTALAAGFLNDVASGTDGSLYVTDTPRNRIYRIAGGAASIALEDSTLGRPNGITWDGTNARFIVVPYGGGHSLFAWTPGGALTPIATSPGSRFDGVEVLGRDTILVASQADTTLHLFVGGTGRPVIRTSGRPADIAVDTRRARVAVPFIALNRVEIWALPR